MRQAPRCWWRLARPDDRLHSRICDTVLIVLALLLLPPPLLAVIVDGLKSPVAGSAGTTGAVAGAVDLVAYCAGGVLCVVLIWRMRRMEQSHFGAAENAGGSAAGDAGMLILAMPGIKGYRLLFTAQQHHWPAAVDGGIVIFTNALMAIPYGAESTGKPDARYHRPLYVVSVAGH